MGTTTNHALRYPEYTGPVAVPDDVKKLAQDVDAKMLATTGGSVTGLVNFSQSPNVPTPTVAGHAANKSFVESVSVLKSLVDAKGDLIVGTANDTVGRLPAGANNTLLVADSAQTAGVKWANVTSAMITDGAVTSAKIAANAVGSLLLEQARSLSTFDGGTPFQGMDPLWPTLWGEPFADCGTPSAGSPTHTFDGGTL